MTEFAAAPRVSYQIWRYSISDNYPFVLPAVYASGIIRKRAASNEGRDHPKCLCLPIKTLARRVHFN